MWAAQGITHPGGYRTALSAGALYPLELYAVVGNVTDLQAGIYKYRPQGLELEKVVEGDVRAELRAAALDQGCVEYGAAVLVFAGLNARPGSMVRGEYEMYIWRWDMLPRIFICRLSRWVWDCGCEAVRLLNGNLTIGLMDKMQKHPSCDYPQITFGRKEEDQLLYLQVKLILA